jgi:HlyD family secretion protein
MRIMRLRTLLVVLALLGAIALVSAYFLYERQDENLLRASGTIEATDVDVSFQIGGRVREVSAVEGQAVKAGDVLARLSSEELTERVNQTQASLEAVSSLVRQQQAALELRAGIVDSQVAQARSQQDAARIGVERLRAGSRPQEVRVAEADLAQAEAQLVQRRADFERASLLIKEGVIAPQQLDAVQAALRTAEAVKDAANQRLALAREGARREDIAEAEARFKTAQAGVALAEAGRKESDFQRAALDAARAHERELQAQLEGARAQLAYTEIRSPLDGVVLTKNVESGEVVSPGTPVVTVANIAELWMNIYIPETQTGLVKLGQEVRVSVDSFPGQSFKGTITFVSSESEFTPKTILTQEERIKLVYRAKVALEDAQQRLKPGMPADAEIDLK